MTETPLSTPPNTSNESFSTSRFMALTGVSAVLFFLTLIPTEIIPEIPVDIDFKAFFVPLVLVALLPVGRPTLAIALGVALGEGIRDLMEGYEIDDPIGFIGYIVGFLAAGYVIGIRPMNKVVLTIGAVICAGLQASIEATSFIVFGEEGISVAAMTALGNTITHGIIMGAIPALFLVPALHGRIERYLGFAPKGTPEPEHSLAELARRHESPDVDGARDDRAFLQARDIWFRFPGRQDAAIRSVDLSIARGQVMGLLGPSGAGKSTLCLCLAGLAPRDTGGEMSGSVRLGDFDPQTASPVETVKRVGIVAENPAAQLTQVRPIDEVASTLMNCGEERERARDRASALLDRVGFPKERKDWRSWELSEGEQRLVVLAAAIAADPSFLCFDGVSDGLDSAGREKLAEILNDIRPRSVVLLVDNDPDALLDMVDTVAVMADGEILAVGPASDILADRDLPAKAGFEPPLRAEIADGIGAETPVVALDDLKPLDGAKISEAQAGRGTGDRLLQIEGLSYSYGDGSTALADIDLTLAEGEVLAVLGAHGAGKTTLAKLIVGLLDANGARISIAGKPAADIAFADRLKLVGMAFSDPDQSISEQTTLREIAYPLVRSGVGKQEARKRAVGAAERTGLGEDLLEKDPTALPLGLRKQVVIATALVRQPKVLILDEPAAGLDGQEQRELISLIRHLKDEGTAVLLFDHNAELALEVADRAALLSKGRLVADGSLQEILAAENRERLRDAEVSPPPAALAGEALGLGIRSRTEILNAVGA